MTPTYAAGIPPFEYSRINHRVLAGRNPLTAADVERLVAEGVTHFLDLRDSTEWLPPLLGEEALAEIEQRKLIRCHVRITDTGAPRMEDFDRCVDFLQTTLQDPQAKVYVHCRAGVERTATILIAWYARREDVSYEQALRQLQQKRPKFAPLPRQERAACHWLELAH